MEENVQLYQHTRLDTGEIFYIGIGRPGRAKQKGRNQHWNSIVKKHGYRVEILEEGLSWYQACELEKMLIALHGRRDLGYGTLVNMTDGGDGVTSLSPKSRAKIGAANKGRRHSHEAKAKIAAASTGRVSPNKGKSPSIETREKISAAGKDRPHSLEHRKKIGAAQIGKKLSPETRAKISASRKAYCELKKKSLNG
jgi:hypothetical protein